MSDELDKRISKLEDSQFKISELNGSIEVLSERLKGATALISERIEHLDKRVESVSGIWWKLALTLFATVGVPTMLERIL